MVPSRLLLHLIPTWELQGALIVSLRNSASGQPIDDNEVRRKFQQFGDVKSVTIGERNDERLVEFYDMRVIRCSPTYFEIAILML